MDPKYLLHIEVPDRVAHGNIAFHDFCDTYREIAKAMALATMSSKTPSICTIAKCPDGSFILLRRLWTAEDEADPPPADANAD